MIHRNLDINHDWQFGKGRENFMFNNDAIGINIKTRLLSFFNDCFFDTDAGIDWFKLLDRNYRPVLERAIRAIIVQSYGVVALKDLVIEYNENRKLIASYSVDTIFRNNYAGKAEV